MTARQHAEIERRAHALRRAELSRLASDLACLARQALAALRGVRASPCPPRAA